MTSRTDDLFHKAADLARARDHMWNEQDAGSEADIARLTLMNQLCIVVETIACALAEHMEDR